MLGHAVTGNVAIGESTSRTHGPFVVLGVLIKILNDPRNVDVMYEQRTSNIVNDPRDFPVMEEDRTSTLFNDPRVIYIKSKD